MLDSFQTCFLLSSLGCWYGRKQIAIYDKPPQLILVSFKMLETIFVKRGQSFDDDNYDGFEQVSSGETICLLLSLSFLGDKNLDGRSLYGRVVDIIIVAVDIFFW